MPRMKTLTVKVPARLSAKVARLAQKRGASQSEIVREALERMPERGRTSFAEATREFQGIVRGPGDLSTNPKYFEGFGK